MPLNWLFYIIFSFSRIQWALYFIDSGPFYFRTVSWIMSVNIYSVPLLWFSFLPTTLICVSVLFFVHFCIYNFHSRPSLTLVYCHFTFLSQSCPLSILPTLPPTLSSLCCFQSDIILMIVHTACPQMTGFILSRVWKIFLWLILFLCAPL